MSDRFAITGYFPDIGKSTPYYNPDPREDNRQLDSIEQQQRDYEEFDRRLDKRFK